MRVECPLCHTEKKSTEKEPYQGICLHCGDIIDFGYPSFAAYRLNEKEADIANNIVYGEGQKKLVAVG